MADIGSTLREARMRSRIDISEVEVSTKIRAKYLRALENEEWDLLPGPVYVKSFLRTYGDYLGLDSRLLVDEFKRRYERPSDHDLRALTTTARERERRSRGPGRLSGALLAPRALIGLALVVIVVALILIGNHSAKSPTGNGRPITPATTGKRSRSHRAHHPASGSTTTGTTPTTTTAARPRNASLTIVPTAAVWICVENQFGHPLLTPRDYAAGESIPTLRARALLLTLGNTGVTMTVNGRAYTPSAQAGGVAIGLRITRAGVSHLSPPPTCTS